MRHRLTSLLGAITLAGTLGACSDSNVPGSPDPVPGVVTIAAAPSPSSLTAAVTTRVVARLRPPADAPAFPAASGKAVFQSSDLKRELEMGVQQIPPGTVVRFYFGLTQIGAAQTADASGAARVVVSTEAGDVVPTTVAWKPVRVKADTGTVVVRGRF